MEKQNMAEKSKNHPLQILEKENILFNLEAVKKDVNEKQAHLKQKDSIKLAFVGSPLLDISANCDQNILDEYDLKSDGCIKADEKHENFLASLFNDTEARQTAGGSALNSARISKWFLEAGGEISFIGCVGNDIYKDWLQKTLCDEDILPLFITIPGKKTGVCACLLTDQGNRSMVTQQGAAANISSEHLKIKHIERNLSRADHIFIVGYLLSHSADVVHELVRMCTTRQILSLSLSAEYICKKYTKDLVDVLSRVDFLFGNESEIIAFAEAVSGQQSITVTSALSIISNMKKSPGRIRIVVVTRGSQPVIVDNGLNDLQFFDIPEKIKVVDGVGCGDAFAGIFVAAFSQTNSINIAVENGIKAAVQVAQVRGFSLPERKIV